MVTKIISTAKSAAKCLDYNEEKAGAGEAFVVMTNVLESDDLTTVYDTFEAYETNPRIDERTTNTGFHLAVNPGPTDSIDENGIKGYIKELMEGLGFKDQPYIVYKHKDIDREHYHVVSVRVDKSGKVIRDSYSGLKIKEIQQRLAPKYGFTVGDASLDLKGEDLMEKPVRFDSKALNVKQQLVSLFDSALEYDFHSFYQFHCVMEAMRVKATMRKRKDGGYSVILIGRDINGKPATRLYSMERHFGIDAGQRYERRLEENNQMGYLMADRKVRLAAVSDYCREHSRSADEYGMMLDELGVGHTIQRNEKDGGIRRVTLVEPTNIALADTSLGRELYLKGFVDMETSGRWERPEPGKKTRAVKGRLISQEMLRELIAFVEKRVAEYRGEKTTRRQEGKKISGGLKLS